MHTKIYTYRINLFSYFLLLLLAVSTSTNTTAQPALSLSPVIETGLSAPIQFVNAADGTNRVFIVQKGGTIRAYDANFNFLTVFLTVTGLTTAGEGGLLSLAFHPDYETNGFFYVYYTNSAGNLQLARYQVSSDPNIADPLSKDTVITIPHPSNSNHNGGELHFGSDGYLYLSTGDGGGGGDVPNNAQNTAVLLGKMLRFNVNSAAVPPFYTIPAGNPYGNEIFDLGLRNPFRWSFDRLTNDIWIGDVGQNSFEEINFRPAGSTGGVNYGWRCYEGDITYNTTGCGPITNYLFPVYNYPTQSPAAITGGIVYRGSAYPSLQGYNISADFYSGTFYKTVSDGAGGWNTSTQVLSPTGIADFGETENGEAYVVSLTGNSVYRLVSSGVVPVTLTSFTGTVNNAGVQLNWQTTREENIQRYQIEYSNDGTSFTFLGAVSAQNGATPVNYTFSHPVNYSGAIFYRLKITGLDGTYQYSPVVRVMLKGDVKNFVIPSVISNGILNVILETPDYNSLELVSVNGTVILKKNIGGQTGNVNVQVSSKLGKGIYMVRLIGSAAVAVQKILIQ